MQLVHGKLVYQERCSTKNKVDTSNFVSTFYGFLRAVKQPKNIRRGGGFH